MAKNSLSKYIWLLDTIRQAKRITFQELNKAWLRQEMSEGIPLSKRTFHKWKDQIFDSFGLIISNENKGDYAYFIENEEELEDNALSSWLVNTLSIREMLTDHRNLQNRICLEEAPSANSYLSLLLQAMENNHEVEMTYQSYGRNQHTFVFHPYCVRLFKQRWYAIGYSVYRKDIRIFSLDRMQGLTILETSFEYPADFSPSAYFEHCYGIIMDSHCTPQKVVIRASNKQAYYLRSLPLHESQKEVERNDEFSVFEFFIRPSFDFIQQVFWNADEVEVLSPAWLRSEMKKKVGLLHQLYAQAPSELQK